MTSRKGIQPRLGPRGSYRTLCGRWNGWHFWPQDTNIEHWKAQPKGRGRTGHLACFSLTFLKEHLYDRSDVWVISDRGPAVARPVHGMGAHPQGPLVQRGGGRIIGEDWGRLRGKWLEHTGLEVPNWVSVPGCGGEVTLGSPCNS